MISSPKILRERRIFALWRQISKHSSTGLSVEQGNVTERKSEELDTQADAISLAISCLTKLAKRVLQRSPGPTKMLESDGVWILKRESKPAAQIWLERALL